ncbi:Putative protein phosphatase 2C-type [Symmachiella dynata]|uniref:PPM-type phosphatase domain-containing protein n=1 Tax=Symmachiella dynata TaxID=2527995 RepID=A0A517ZNM9_9PLAN|nr:PP2C family serine/threonine-protein phosphatase [Symmachiella dynata]QDT48478.1 Putative protein phosphatase 2C-type [Symmachiella dynata]QDU44068.1 Putative protein phosphatase 2C-type [Symmachiella dynata]
MLWEQKVEFAAKSDIGFRRQNNQDSYGIHLAPDAEAFHQRGHLFLVADGMGGHAVGELASKMAADSIPHSYQKLQNLPIDEALEQAIIEANTGINTRGRQNHDFLRMGTTLTALVLSPTGAIAGHVGDSRLYRIRDAHIEQLTFDHSLQWELLKQGQMSAEEIFLYEPRNVITRCLGPEAHVEVDIEGAHEILSGDIFLLCSDGLTGLLDDNEIGTIARELPPAEACQLLVHLANLRGGPDNITVVIVRVNAPVGDIATPPPRPRYDDSGGLSWGWGLALSLLSIVLAIGVPLTLMGLRTALNYLLAPGLTLLGLAGIQIILMVWIWWNQRRERAKAPPVSAPKGGPYRYAEANMTRKLAGQLATIEHDLQQSAIEEGWTVDWKSYGTAYRDAKSSLERQQFSPALRSYGKVIDFLMSGLQSHRRSRAHAAKWGIPPREQTLPADTNGD